MTPRNLTLLFAVAACWPLTTGAASAAGCTAHRAVCESACTPERVALYHGGSPRRCEASCEPRWQQCLRTGIWADLERRSSGSWEPADGF